MTNPAEFLAKKTWGVFNHYLYQEVCNTENPHNRGTGITDWDTAVRMFDVERAAYTLHKMGAGYYFITLQQGTRHMLAPNATFDRIAGTKPGEACSTRDLPLELAEALAKYDIDLCLYYTGDGPHKDEEIRDRFDCFDSNDVSESFCNKWASVVGEYAERYGDKVKAWWLDGFYTAQFGYTNELREIFYRAIKKGNPNAAVAFNDGVKYGFWREFPKEEFVCGEQNDFLLAPYSHSIEGAQGHILAPLGYDSTGMHDCGGWAQPGLRHTKEYMRDYMRKVRRIGAAATVDMLVHIDGSLDIEQEAAMRWVGENL